MIKIVLVRFFNAPLSAQTINPSLFKSPYFCATNDHQMQEIFTADGLISLLTLALLEVILGIDNVIFVSIIMGRLKKTSQPKARRLWMLTGIGVRVILLFCLSWLVQQKGKNLFTLFGKGFDLSSLVM